MTDVPKIPAAWKHELLKRPDYRGGWWMPIVCTGQGRHSPRILSHAYESNGGVVYTAPGQTVRQTRRSSAIGVPGQSRESISLVCPSCPANREVSRVRWGKELENARRVEQAWLDVATLG
jgi:hypothetical protein